MSTDPNKPDTNDRIRTALLDLLLDPRVVAVSLVFGVLGYVLGRLSH